MNSEFAPEPVSDRYQDQPLEGWTLPKPDRLPRPTYWPAALALAITFLFWGLVASPAISVIGLALAGVALAGWIGELLRER